MSNTDIIEVQLMLRKLEEVEPQEPKAVLEKLSVLGCEIFSVRLEGLRVMAYGLWLQKHKPEWFEIYVESIKILKQLSSGCLTELSFFAEEYKFPEGWIAFMPYIEANIDPKYPSLVIHEPVIYTGDKKQ